jgi:sugar lactone lactonase YvrE
MRTFVTILAGLLLAVPVALAAEKSGTYAIPGSAVFPEGVTADHQRLYVSSTTDGTIFAGDLNGTALAPFLPGGADGRTTAVGVHADHGRLYVAGGATGKVFVYEIATRRLVAVLDAGGGFLNDLTIEQDGDVIVTDSGRSVLWRFTPAGARNAIAYDPGARNFLNANGIVAAARDVVVYIDYDDGTLNAVDTDSGRQTPIPVAGGPLVAGDGIALQGRTLYVVRNSPASVTEVQLDGQLRSGRVVHVVSDPTFAFPTTVAVADSRLLVVNSQFDKRGATPAPFTVTALRRP